jgi:hypothetical protein
VKRTSTNSNGGYYNIYLYSHKASVLPITLYQLVFNRELLDLLLLRLHLNSQVCLSIDNALSSVSNRLLLEKIVLLKLSVFPYSI